MADFHAAFERVLEAEGGWTDHTVEGDRGGRTFAGISERANPDWRGWRLLDESGGEVTPEIRTSARALYKRRYFDPITDAGYVDQGMVDAVFAFAVNAGVRPALRIAAPLGPYDVAVFTLHVIRHYELLAREPSQRKFLRGWVRRALNFAGV